jgi:hypothetical protein
MLLFQHLLQITVTIMRLFGMLDPPEAVMRPHVLLRLVNGSVPVYWQYNTGPVLYSVETV